MKQKLFVRNLFMTNYEALLVYRGLRECWKSRNKRTLIDRGTNRRFATLLIVLSVIFHPYVPTRRPRQVAANIERSPACVRNCGLS